MPITRPNVDYFHEMGSRDGSSFAENLAPDESTATAQFFVPWNQRYDAAISLLGYAQLAGPIAAPDSLERLTPSQHPDIPTLYATKVDIRGHRFTNQRVQVSPTTVSHLNQFEKAVLTVQYNHISYGIEEDDEVAFEYQRYTSIESLQPSADYLSLPAGVMKYTTAAGTPPHGLPIPFNLGIIQPLTQIKVKWWGLPFGLYSPLEFGPWAKRVFGDGISPGFIGTVNQAEFLGYQPWTLLLTNVELIQRRLPLVGLGWDVVFEFTHNPNQWNRFYYFDIGGAGSGYFFASKNGTNQIPGALPNNVALYNENAFVDLFSVA